MSGTRAGEEASGRGGELAISMKRFYASSLLALFIPLFLGLLVGYIEPGFGEEALIAGYGDIEFIKRLPPLGLFAFIISRNSLIGLIVVLSGVAIGLPTLFILVVNGVTVGAIIGWLLKYYGISVVASGILPHGVFEIPAVIISGAYGLKIGASAMSKLRGREARLSDALAEGLRAYLSKALPLFAIAALVESFITPLVLLTALGR